MFLAGSIVGLVCISVAVRRSRLAPVAAAVLLMAFPFLDLLVPGHLGTVVAHAVLLAGLAWIGGSLVRGATAAETRPEVAPRRPDRRRPAVIIG